jgi:hypothetical protein
LLWDTDELLFEGLVIDVGEMDVEELHASDLLELLLDPAAACFARGSPAFRSTFPFYTSMALCGFCGKHVKLRLSH